MMNMTRRRNRLPVPITHAVGIGIGLFLLGATAVPCGAFDLAPHVGPDRPLWETSQQEWIDTVLRPGRFLRGNPSRSTQCRLGDIPLAEALLAWDDAGRLSGVRLIVTTRGDAGDLPLEEWERVREACARYIANWAGGAPGRTDEERVGHALVSRTEWRLPDRTMTLVSGQTVRHVRSSTREVIAARGEFVRIDILPVSGSSPADAAVGPSTRTSAAKASWADRVERRPNGDVVITGVPMVDQGERGYCAVATIARMMLYYGMDTDQHEIAQLAHSSPTAGTNTDEMMRVLRRSGEHLGITSRRHLDLDPSFIRRMVQLYNQSARRRRMATVDLMHIGSLTALYTVMDGELLTESRMRQRAEYNRFMDAIRRYVEDGVPLAWSLVLGKVPEEGRTPQTAGGHMRLIIGYNDTTEEILFSDSWGEGHEEKRIRMDHAWAATTGLYTIEPR